MPPKKIIRSGTSPRQRRGNVRFLDTVKAQTTPVWPWLSALANQPYNRWQKDYCHVCKESARDETDAFRSKFTRLNENAMTEGELQQCLDEIGQTHHTFPVHAYSGERFEDDCGEIDSAAGLKRFINKIEKYHGDFMLDNDDVCRDYFTFLASKARLFQTETHQEEMEAHLDYFEQRLPYLHHNPYLAFKIRYVRTNDCSPDGAVSV